MTKQLSVRLKESEIISLKNEAKKLNCTITQLIKKMIKKEISHEKLYLVAFGQDSKGFKTMTINKDLYDFYTEKGVTFYLLETFSAHKVN